MTKQVQIMSGDDYRHVLEEIDGSYVLLAKYLGTDRRTTHRWLTDGPNNGVARLLLLMRSRSVSLRNEVARLERERKKRRQTDGSGRPSRRLSAEAVAS